MWRYKVTGRRRHSPLMAGEQSTKEELASAQTSAWSYAFGCIRPMSLMVAVQLGIPDAVHTRGGTISLSDLASAVGVPVARVAALRRLMRALSHFGIFQRIVKARKGVWEEEEEEEVYSSTTFSQQLVRDSPTTAALLIIVGMHPLHVTPWYSMATWFRGEGPTASTGFEAVHGESVWESAGRVPEFGDVFNGAMACDSRWALGLVAREHPEVFRGLASLVDVGGGTGASAKALRDAFPEMRCTVLELPHVVAASPAIEGVDFVEGDMFEHVPPADAVLLKWVLHDWGDEDCVRILRRCREAILPARERGGKVIILEMVVGGGGGDGHELVEAQHLLDLHMLAVTGGRERDEVEWRRILAAAAFSGCKFTPALGPRSIIEAYP